MPTFFFLAAISRSNGIFEKIIVRGKCALYFEKQDKMDQISIKYAKTLYLFITYHCNSKKKVYKCILECKMFIAFIH